jgi:hypothetical protein
MRPLTFVLIKNQLNVSSCLLMFTLCADAAVIDIFFSMLRELLLSNHPMGAMERIFALFSSD